MYTPKDRKIRSESQKFCTAVPYKILRGASIGRARRRVASTGVCKDAYAARSHAGQAIYVHSNDKVVIAVDSAGLELGPDDDRQARCAFVQALYDVVQALYAVAVARGLRRRLISNCISDNATGSLKPCKLSAFRRAPDQSFSLFQPQTANG
ncbi:hypothetical protein GWE18_40145 [Bradyrhizobium sp. CSA112]|uniref:hypothetical protein n=1 Tax=Bradyrhizobium sp. CSA112 TaxID=2699170 RepID=UPI0023AF62F4|nr:hypothetical protein [Bradyrhizobium sp. CSA112]MDE5458838.1 hypothetical protein [Bradyrhizobium sp. CSA112]